MFARTVMVYSMFAAACMAADEAPKPGTYYTHGQLGIKKIEAQGSKITLTFKPVDEQFYWCPGAKVQVTKKATVVTFVRCKTSEDWKIDAKAKIGKRLIRTITLDTQNKNVYVRNGPKKFKLLYAVQQPKKKEQTKKADDQEQEGPKGPSARLLQNEFAVSGA